MERGAPDSPVNKAGSPAREAAASEALAGHAAASEASGKGSGLSGGFRLALFGFLRLADLAGLVFRLAAQGFFGLALLAFLLFLFGAEALALALQARQFNFTLPTFQPLATGMGLGRNQNAAELQPECSQIVIPHIMPHIMPHIIPHIIRTSFRTSSRTSTHRNPHIKRKRTKK